MKYINRRVSGKIAKNSGRSFESCFENMCNIQGIGVVRIPDSGKRVSAKLFIQVKSPFDFCLSFNGTCAHIDTKKSDSKSFSYSMIDQEQVNKLLILRSGGPSGYVICMGDDSVYWVDVNLLLNINPFSSIDFSKCVLLGNRISFDCRRIFDGYKT